MEKYSTMGSSQVKGLKDSACQEGYSNFLVGKYFGILKDREKNKNYDKLLESLVCDLLGATEEFDCINLNKLYYKTLSLKYLSYPLFRENIMDCIQLVKTVFGETSDYGT